MFFFMLKLNIFSNSSGKGEKDSATSLEEMEWYAGELDRSDAEQLVLARSYPVGTFLVREWRGQLALTRRTEEDAIKHHRIHRTPKGKLYVEERYKFKSLPRLVDFYKKNDKITVAAPRPQRTAMVFPDLEIPRRLITILGELGKGNYGRVQFGRFLNASVAVKSIKNGRREQSALFLREAHLMRELQHENVLQLYGVCTLEEPVWIVTEYMVNGDLLKFIRNNKTLSDVAKINICEQISAGMECIERHSFVHRDLAARNVLLGLFVAGIPHVKVADFGLARKLQANGIYENHTDTGFPAKWTAPEAIREKRFTSKNDVWSYGIVLFEIFSEGKNQDTKEMLKFLEAGRRLERPLHCPQTVYKDLMLRCWELDPQKRPSFNEIHSYWTRGELR